MSTNNNPSANNYYGYTSSGLQYPLAPTTTYPVAPATAEANASAYGTYTAQPSTFPAVQAVSTPVTYAANPTYATSTAYTYAAAAPPPPQAPYQQANHQSTSYSSYQVPQYQSYQPKADQYPSFQSSTIASYAPDNTVTPTFTAPKQVSNAPAPYIPLAKNAPSYQKPRPVKNLPPQNNPPNRYYPSNRDKFQKKPKPVSTPQLHYCEICKISCGGPDTYKAHLEGKKHKKKEESQKEADKTEIRGMRFRCLLCDISSSSREAYDGHVKGARHQKVVRLHKTLGKPVPEQEPEIIGQKPQEAKVVAPKAEKVEEKKPEAVQTENIVVEPVGEEFIEEVKVTGKTSSFKCTLCDCPMTSASAKDVHTRGRRHRLMYKKKVDPKLVVEIKPSDRKHSEGADPEEPMPHFNGPMPLDEKYMLTKDFRIYPKQEDLDAILKNVINVEKALKTVAEEFEKDDSKIFKSALRVGNLAKGLLLAGEHHVEMILLFSVKPTHKILAKVAESLTKQLASQDGNSLYEVSVQDEAILVKDPSEPAKSIALKLTSPTLREPTVGEEPEGSEDLLNKEACLESLASLRRAKWFQYNSDLLDTLALTVRILRDLSQRVPAWSCLSQWALELLTENILRGVGHPLPPALGFGRILEAVASGFLSTTGPGLMDPCEKEPTNVIAGLTEEERTTLTASAADAMKLLPIGQIFKVLGMNPFPRAKPFKKWFPRKRKADDAAAKPAEDDKKPKLDAAQEKKD